MSKRNPHDIGKGLYEVFYEKCVGTTIHRFEGVCENFTPTGKNAFWNEENEQMLVVDYQDILGIYPIKKEK